ncbi:GTPase HflX [Prosthecomicrobium pneumaticum]|uniref:GTPase HflX n=1 Tax=Prosthecomicrobium pneumaticum TaxID=81895 RepID=A0A7W9FKN7_9HYPH|nr:GTPase HflX [Prosthecomicrobium pneumaticum]MBB5751168.1 GTP-binding protein HflX [Prosthecomicrobium pneumaticum]
MNDIHESPGDRIAGRETKAAPDRALVLVPVPTGRAKLEDGSPLARRSVAARVDEAVGLARAIELDVVEAIPINISEYRPATLIGKGKVEEVAAKAEAGKIDLVVVDHALSPVQQQNLEKALKAKVIDRTGLILEIFGERAQTKEGRLQVELAHLTYQKSRLVRSWTHLERQRGGFGFLGGPGETQIEADRRMIQERIARIEHDLETVVRTRRLQREGRRKVPHPIVALVGYTNAGKSTLFNALTHSDIFAKDLLFATLDPTLRQLKLPHGGEVILSDTVGFISNLPTHLVAAFRATLEEVIEATIILHVRDIAHEDTEAQAADVAQVLSQLGIDVAASDRVIEVWNKIDLLPPDQRPGAEEIAGRRIVPVSALTGEGLPRLLSTVEAKLGEGRAVFHVALSGEALGGLHRLYELGNVLERRDEEDGTVHAVVRVADKHLDAFRDTFPGARERRVN